MLASDFKICEYYSKASIEGAKENFKVNFNSIENEKARQELLKIYTEIVKKYEVK